MIYAVIPTLVLIVSFNSYANETHELAEQGNWPKVGELIRSGKYNVDEPDHRGLTLSDIALNRNELCEFELHCHSHEYTHPQALQPVATAEAPENIQMTSDETSPANNLEETLQEEQTSRCWCSFCGI
jgi:hypothetical protein